MDAWLVPHLQRRRQGVAHPVWDFLFTYYSETPGRLRRWHPGIGRTLRGPAAREWLGRRVYAHAGVDEADGVSAVGLHVAAFLDARVDLVLRVADLLRATAGRPGFFG